MEHPLQNSIYYSKWSKLADVRDSTMSQYLYCLLKFEHYLINERGFSGELDFDKFFYYPEDGSYLPMNEQFIIDYLSYMERKTTPHHLYMHVTALKNFFRFLKVIQLIKMNPMAYYKNPYYNPKIQDRAISLSDSQKLWAASVKLDPSDSFLRMNSVLILLMFTTGLRNKEIRELTIEQLDFQRKVIYVDRGQKTKGSTVYMPKILCSELERMINHPDHKVWQQKGNNMVFFADGRKFDQFTINKKLRDLCKTAGVKKVTAHCLRHTMAALLLSRGVDISIIQRQLRHKYPETTLRYLPSATIDEIQMGDFDVQ